MDLPHLAAERRFVEDDMDLYDVEDLRPDIRATMGLAGIEITEPGRWPDQQQPPQ
jgi:hypothetical protein